MYEAEEESVSAEDGNSSDTKSRLGCRAELQLLWGAFLPCQSSTGCIYHRAEL